MSLNVGLIRVVTLEDEELLNLHGRLLEDRFGLQVESKCIEDQPEGIHDEATERQAIDKIVSLAEDFEGQSKDLIFISCAADPALEEARKEVKIPVIGAGSSCASIAMAVGSRVGVIGITQTAPVAMKKILRDSFVAYLRPEGVNNTLDLLVEKNRKNVIDAAYKLKDLGCDVIALGCTGMTTIGIADHIRRQVDIPVVDPLIASGMIISHIGHIY